MNERTLHTLPPNTAKVTSAIFGIAALTTTVIATVSNSTTTETVIYNILETLQLYSYH